MLADLLTPPTTAQEWEIYDLAHRKSHEAIIAAALLAGVELTEFILSPITGADLTGFLQRNQQAHLQMDALTAFPSVDLQDVDFSNSSQVEEWVFLHFTSHFQVEQVLGISS